MSDFSSTPLENCAWVVEPNVLGTARASAFLGSFVPTTLAVVFLSTPRLRKQWAFRILVFALVVTLGKGVIELQSYVGDVNHLGPDGWPATTLGDTLLAIAYFLQWYVPWICDCALLLKLLAFHPSAAMPWRRRAAIIVFPMAMHIPRLPLLVAANVLNMTREWEEGDYGYLPLLSRRLLVAEGALQVAENFYCSGFLLYQAHRRVRTGQVVLNQRGRRARLGLRYFTESIFFTFLPATVLQVAWLLTVTAATPDPEGKLARADFYLRMFKVVFSVNFSLLAVWWATARIYALEAEQTDSQLTSVSEKEHRAAQDTSMLFWALGPIEPEESSLTEARKPVKRISTAEELKSLIVEGEEEEEGTQSASAKERL